MRRLPHVGLLLALSFALSACKADGQRLSEILELEGDVASGGDFFSSNCATCHGVDAAGGGAPDIRGREVDVVAEAALSGPGAMPSFSDSSDQEIADVAAYVNSL